MQSYVTWLHSTRTLPNAEPSSRLVYTILRPQIEWDQLAAVTADVWRRVILRCWMRWDLVIEGRLSTVVVVAVVLGRMEGRRGC